MIPALLLFAVAAAQQDTIAQRTGPDSLAQRLEAVTVNAARSDDLAAARWSRSAGRTPAPLRLTPASVSAFSAPVLRALGLTTMTRAMEYVPGVTMGQGEGHRDAPTIRGQSTTADFYLDGVRDDVQYFRDMYNVAQLDVLRGAQALAFGRGGGGGVINRVTKQPTWSPTSELTATAGSYAERRTTMDFGRSLSPALATRMNALYEQGHTFRNPSALEKIGIAPTLGYRSRRLVVSAGGEFFRDRRGVDRGIPSSQGAPVSTAQSTFFGDPTTSRSHLDATSGFTIVDAMLTSSLTSRTQLRVVDYTKSYRNVYASGAVRDNGVNVPLGAYQSSTDRRNVFLQSDATWHSAPAMIQHALTMGGEWGRQTSDNRRLTGFFNNSTTQITVPVRAPTVQTPVVFRARPSDANNQVVADVAAALVQDQVAIGTHVRFTAGLRAERVALTLNDHRDGATFARTDVLLSPKFGLVVTPRGESLALYVAHGASSLPSAGDQFASLSASTETLKPERFTNNEIGVKWGVHDRLELTSAAYQIDRTNSTAPDPLDATRLVQTGHQRTSGVELTAAGNVLAAWNVVAAGSMQSARYRERSVSAAEGATVPLVPRVTRSLWNEIRLHTAGTVGVGLVHQSQRFAATDNAVVLPAFTRIDASASVALPSALATVGDRPLRVRLQVENVFNRRYFPTSHGNNNIMPGAPRLLRVSIGTHM